MQPDGAPGRATSPGDVRVVVLAGGAGVRLRPYSTFLPKPMMPVGDMPILEVMLRQLARQGFRRVTLSVNHLAELIRAFFGDGTRLGLAIDYCMEDQPLGTAGSLPLVANLSDPFLAMNGDLLTSLDYRSLLSSHLASGAAATVAACSREVRLDYGVLETGRDGELSAYVEKPSWSVTVSMGINAFDRAVLELIPRGRRFDVPDLVASLLAAGRPVATHRETCEWLDIGRADDHERALKAFAERRDLFLPEDG
jgi:NDP-mannose synthase